MRKIVTKEEEQEWAKRYLEGETCRKISEDYPYNENTISKHIKKMGISRGRGHLKEKDDLKPIILKEYVEDKYATFTSLGEKYHLSDRTISSWVKENGIEQKQISGIISSCDESYFENIDNPNKAYLLGFITADGAVVGNSCSIEIHEKDKDLIYFAKQEINSRASITKCFYSAKRNFRIAFCSKKICQDLKKYGVIQNKSKIIKKVPIEYIPKKLLPYYFRGLIDGDGCIHKNGSVSIYSGSKEFIASVQKILVEEAGVKKLGIYTGTTYFVTWSSKSDRKKLFKYLYNDLDKTFYYKRKYQRIYNSLHDNTELTN